MFLTVLAISVIIALVLILDGRVLPPSMVENSTMFRDTLEHEQKVTAMIGNLASIAAEEKDFATSNMLVWFIDEQVEEEASTREKIGACEAVEGNKFGLYMLDKELAARTYTQASPLGSAAE